MPLYQHAIKSTSGLYEPVMTVGRRTHFGASQPGSGLKLSSRLFILLHQAQLQQEAKAKADAAAIEKRQKIEDAKIQKGNL